MIDTHAHLDSEEYVEDFETVLAEAVEAGVSDVIIPACNSRGFAHIIEIAEKHPNVWFAAGIHPHDSGDFIPALETEILQIAKNPKCRAIGEIGLDYHYDFFPKEVQQKVFRRQVQMAKELNLPMIIHNREASDDTLEILRSEDNFHGVMHCFGSTPAVAEYILDKGMMISFTGSVTFKKSNLAPVVEITPLSRIMLETDSPFMTPVPFRGRRNHPKYVQLIAEKIAEIKQLNIEEVIEMTTNNAKKFFNLVLPIFVFVLASFSMNAQTDDDYYEDDEAVAVKTENPYKRPLFGIGGFVGTNTVVETYKVEGGDKEVSYDGLVTPGVIVTVAPLDFMIASFSYCYSKNNKIEEEQHGLVGATSHNVFELNTQWIVNPRSRINFAGNLGLNMIINTTNIGAKGGNPENKETDIGLTAGLGIIGNIKIGKYGMLNITAGWDILFPFSKSTGYLYDNSTKNLKEYDVSKYFSVPKFGLVFYPNIY